jgi:hypothetical protein
MKNGLCLSFHKRRENPCPPKNRNYIAINLYSNSTILNFGENDGRDEVGWRRRSNIEAESRIKDQNRLQRV